MLNFNPVVKPVDTKQGKSKARTTHKHQHVLESLEQRQMLSGVIQLPYEGLNLAKPVMTEQNAGMPDAFTPIVAAGAVAAPSNLKSTGTTGATVTLTWAYTFSGIPPLRYEIQYRKSTDTQWSVQTVEPFAAGYAPSTTATINTLSPNTAYEFQVRVVTIDGASGWTPSTYATTTGGTPLAAPANVTATVKDATTLTFNWQVNYPLFVFSNSTCTGYTIQFATDANFNQIAQTQSIPFNGVLSGTCTADVTGLTGLTTGTRYYVRIAANGIGDYSDSPYVNVTPKLAVPTTLGGTPASASSMTLTWTASPGVTGYIIYRSSSQTSGFTQVGTSTTASFTNTGLTTGTAYYYSVVATNSLSSSLTSDQSVTFTWPAIPVKPVVSVSAVTATNVTLQWNTPVTFATKFNIYRSTSSTGTYTLIGTSTGGTYSDTSVLGNTTYYYEVVAVNGSINSGNGPYSANSDPCSATTPLQVPANVNAALKSGLGVTLTWTSNNSNVKYNVLRSTSANGTYTAVNASLITSTAYTDTVSSGNTTYYYKIVAISATDSSKQVMSPSISVKVYGSATIAWIGTSGGDFNDPKNWDLGRVPNANDDVLIASSTGNACYVLMTTTFSGTSNAFAAQYTFRNLTLGDNVEILSYGISEIDLTVTQTLELGANAKIRVRNGYQYYNNAPTTSVTSWNINNVFGVLHPNTYGKGGNGGYGGNGQLYAGGYYGDGGWGGDGGFGGGTGGYGGGGNSLGASGVPNGGSLTQPWLQSGGQGNAGSYSGGGQGGRGSGGNGGAGGAFDPVLETGIGGGGGGSGGYGGGVLVIDAKQILYGTGAKFVVAGQCGGIGYGSTAGNGQDGAGGLLAVRSNLTQQDIVTLTNMSGVGAVQGSGQIGSVPFNSDGGHGAPSTSSLATPYIIVDTEQRPITTAPATPTFSKQPVSANYTQGQTAIPLSVAASGNGTLSYQWYQNGAKITGATSASYMPSTSTVATSSYYCIVTNTLNSQTKTAQSVAVTITVSASGGTTQMTPTAPTGAKISGDYNPAKKKGTLTWSAVANATGYKIMYSNDGGITWKTKIIKKNVTSLKLSGITPDVVVRVYAINASGTSTSYSQAPAIVKDMPNTPTNAHFDDLSSYNAAKKKGTLFWDYVSNATGYKIMYSNDGGITWKTKTIKKNVTSLNLSGLVPGAIIRVYAINAWGTSAGSSSTTVVA